MQALTRRSAIGWLLSLPLTKRTMAAEAPSALHPLPTPGVGFISSMRLAPGPALRLLVADDGANVGRRCLLAVELLAGAEPALLTGPHLVAELPGRLDWDARLTALGWQVVTLEAGSGVAPLLLLSPPDYRRQPVDAQNRRGIFSKPRFTGDDGSIIAVKVDDDQRIALYLAGAGGSPAVRQLIDVPLAGPLQDVQRIAWRGGWLLAMQTFMPGPYRLQGAGAAAMVLRSGRLKLQLLNKDGSAVGEPWSPLGDRAIFEFAIAAGGDTLGLLATTSDGWVFTRGVPDAQGRGLLSVEERGLGELRSPCLQFLTQSWRLLVLRAAVSTVPPAPQVLWCDWPEAHR